MATNNKTKKVGRPSVVDWTKFTLQWKNKTNAEIAKDANCSVVNVFLKRKKLIQKAKDAGKDGSFFQCTKPKWTRGRHITSVKQAPESKVEDTAVPAV